MPVNSNETSPYLCLLGNTTFLLFNYFKLLTFNFGSGVDMFLPQANGLYLGSAPVSAMGSGSHSPQISVPTTNPAAVVVVVLAWMIYPMLAESFRETRTVKKIYKVPQVLSADSCART